jgi:hypothetical protein
VVSSIAQDNRPAVDRWRLMEFPSFLSAYFIAISAGGFIALAAKVAVYWLFQRRLGMGKVVLLGLGVHVVSLIGGIGLGLLVLPEHGYGWHAPAWASFVYAVTASAIIEVACLLSLRKKLALRLIVATAVTANVTYYLGSLICMAVTELLLRLGPK